MEVNYIKIAIRKELRNIDGINRIICESNNLTKINWIGIDPNDLTITVYSSIRNKGYK